jgi:hypothetical protein
MSISPVGATGSTPSQAAALAAAALQASTKPEAAETPGAPDHDHDADNRVGAAAPGPAAAAKPAALSPGTVNLKA